jgi:phage protein D/phage baseplate assembly protein gpV
MSDQLVTTVRVEINGRPLADDLLSLLTSMVVDTSLVDPDHMVLTFRDPDRVVLADSGALIGSQIKVGVVDDDNPSGVWLASGDVTALEAEFSSGGSFTIVRGLDAIHRLQRGSATRAFQYYTTSDIVRTVALNAGLSIGRVDSTPVVHPHVIQANQSDWEFLQQLAREAGYEVDVVDGKLNFVAPMSSAAAPAEGTADGALQPGQLVKGVNILDFQGSITGADQVANVEVRGWDPVAKQAVVANQAAASNGAQPGVKPAAIASKFGSPVRVATATPFDQQAGATAMAGYLSRMFAGASAEFRATVVGDPYLRAGTAVSLALVGDPFDGLYLLTSACHVYDATDGYRTHVQVSGSLARSLLDLTSGGMPAGAGAGGGGGLVSGVVPAIVTNVHDIEQRCRVKLSFPWLSDDYESDWARTVQPGAGANRGAVVLPEVGDEVLVAFEQGDMRRPYVVGGLHNGVDTPKVGPGLVGGDGKVARRGFVSRDGHALIFFDGPAKQGVAVMTMDQGLRISLNKTGMAIKVTSNGAVHIKGATEVNVQSDGTMALEAATTMTIKANASLSIEAPTIEVKSPGMVAVKGNPVALN